MKFYIVSFDGKLQHCYEVQSKFPNILSTKYDDDDEESRLDLDINERNSKRIADDAQSIRTN